MEGQSINKEGIIVFQRSVQLIKLARTLHVPASSLLMILKNAGFVFPNKPSGINLKEEHLEVLSKAYASSVKSLFLKIKKSLNKRLDAKPFLYADFFKQFISESETFTIEEVYNEELDLQLIEHYFDRVVSASYYLYNRKKSDKIFCVKIVLKIIQKFKALRRKVGTTFINFHFHNFSRDEDPASSELKLRFS